jgi:hypothetical protein
LTAGQRAATRPADARCNSGAFEYHPTISLYLTLIARQVHVLLEWLKQQSTTLVSRMFTEARVKSDVSRSDVSLFQLSD